MSRKKAPRVTAADLIKLDATIRALHRRASANLQGTGVCAHLEEMMNPIATAVGVLTLLESYAKAKK